MLQTGTPRADAPRNRALAVALALLTSACGDVGGARDPRPGDLFVADMDAGAAQPDGERLGAIFRVRQEDGAPVLTTFAEDPRWREPVDVAVLPDKCVLVLDQQWKPDDGPARGAIFKTYWAGGPVSLLWSDPRARQLVAMAWSPREQVLYVSDRDADPSGLGQNTGCVFAVPLASDDTAGTATIAAAGTELVTPGALAVLHDGRVLLMDADSNPHHTLLPDGRPATPGELFELKDGALLPLLVPDVTVSPVALIERDLRTEDEVREDGWRDRRRNRHVRTTRHGEPAPDAPEASAQQAPVAPSTDTGAHPPPAVTYEVSVDLAPELRTPEETAAAAVRAGKLTLYLVDANEGTERGVVGDGALFRVDLAADGASLHKLVDSLSVGRPRAMVDPAGGDFLADGRLVLADANADPLKLGEDGTKKGVYGTGRGALLAVDPDAGTVQTLLASDRFVSPVVVRRVRP